MAIQVYTTVSKEVLALYDEIMEGNGEEPFTVYVDNIGDVIADIIQNNAEGNEFVIDFDYLREEIRYNLLEKQYDMARDQVDNAMMSPQKMNGMMRKYNNLLKKFDNAQCDEVDKWLIGEV